jgi:hypothetical protein
LANGFSDRSRCGVKMASSRWNRCLDKTNLHVFWLKDDALEDPDLLPPPDEAAAEIVEGL